MMRKRLFWFTAGLATTGAAITHFSLRDLWTDFASLSYDVSLFFSSVCFPRNPLRKSKAKFQNSRFILLKIVKIRCQNLNLILIDFTIICLMCCIALKAQVLCSTFSFFVCLLRKFRERKGRFCILGLFAPPLPFFFFLKKKEKEKWKFNSTKSNRCR